MADHDAILQAIGDLREDIGAVKAGQDAVVSRLDKLNGKIAEHEKRVGDLELDQARREGAAAAHRSWWDRLQPAVYLCAGGFLVMALTHAGDLLAALKS